MFNYLLESVLEISSVATEHNKSLCKCLKENCLNIIHQFDVRHFSKKIKASLCTKRKQKGNKQLVGWIKSIINHFWWNSATCQENPVIIREKWLSVFQHVSDKHDWEDNKFYHCCEHGPLQEGGYRWLPVYNALKHIATDEMVLNDFSYLTKLCHSGVLEVFHSLYNMYFPKRIAFSCRGM